MRCLWYTTPMIVVVTSSRRRGGRTINPFYVLGPISLVLLLLAGIWYGKNALFIRSAEEVTGTVIDIVEQGRGVTPLVKFKTSQGEEMRFKPHSSQSPSPYAIGDQVKVYYDATSPAHSKLDSFVSLWFGPMMIAIAGAVNALLAIILGIVYKRHQKRYQQ